MTHFEDLSRYTYDSAAGGAATLNVGWLDSEHSFPRGNLPAAFLDSLWDYCSILVAPTRGLHLCELCKAPTSAFSRGGLKLLLGSGEIRVFNERGEMFAAPNLVYHYVCDHQYLPPRAFMEAVETSAHPTSAEYAGLLATAGVIWQQNAALIAEPEQFRFVRTQHGVERQAIKKND